MATQPQWATSHRFLEDTGITTSAEMTTTLRTELVTNLGWTEPTSGTFRSPPDAAGRYFDIVVSEPSAVRWQWSVQNESATVICVREVLLAGTGENVRYHTGAAHVWVEVDKGAGTSEALGAGLLDLTPEAQDAHSNYVWGRGHRTSAGATDANNDIGDFFLEDNGSPAAGTRLLDVRNAQGTQINHFTLSGARSYIQPAILTGVNGTAQQVIVGRMYQFVITSYGYGSSFTIPIGDAAETGLFRPTRVPKSGPLGLAIRGD